MLMLLHATAWTGKRREKSVEFQLELVDRGIGGLRVKFKAHRSTVQLWGGTPTNFGWNSDLEAFRCLLFAGFLCRFNGAQQRLPLN